MSMWITAVTRKGGSTTPTRHHSTKEEPVLTEQSIVFTEDDGTFVLYPLCNVLEVRTLEEK